MPSLFKVTRGAQGAGAGVHRGPQPGTRGWSSCSTQGAALGTSSVPSCPCSLGQLLPAPGAGGSTGGKLGRGERFTPGAEREALGQTQLPPTFSASRLNLSKTLQGLCVVPFSSLPKKIAWFSPRSHVKWQEVVAF